MRSGTPLSNISPRINLSIIKTIAYSILFNPLLWILIVFILSKVVSGVKLKSYLVRLSLLLLVVFTSKPLSNLVIKTIEYPCHNYFDDHGSFDIAILLTGFGSSGSGRPNSENLYYVNTTANRLTQTIELFSMNMFEYLIISGTNPHSPDVLSKAQATKELFVKLGFNSDLIFTEELSTNTYESIRESQNLLEYKGMDKCRIALVTSAIHMPRAYRCAKNLGLEVTPIAVDYRQLDSSWNLGKFIPSHDALVDWKLIITELVKRGYYRMRE